MTSHAFQSWQDRNADPRPFDMNQSGRDTAVNALRDVLALCREDLTNAEARRVSRRSVPAPGRMTADFATVGPRR
jgi:hypothetical protein